MLDNKICSIFLRVLISKIFSFKDMNIWNEFNLFINFFYLQNKRTVCTTLFFLNVTLTYIGLVIYANSWPFLPRASIQNNEEFQKNVFSVRKVIETWNKIHLKVNITIFLPIKLDITDPDRIDLDLLITRISLILV